MPRTPPPAVIPAKERAKKERKLRAWEDSAASFARRQEAIYKAGASSYMRSRLRGYAAASRFDAHFHL
jgi:hypothetical protein